MALFLLKRFAQALFVMLIISFLAFSIQSHLGDPLRELVGQSVSQAERIELRNQLGLNDPFYVQYTRFLSNALQGDFGTSYFFKEPTLDIILEKLVATLELVFLSTFIIIGLSIPLGIYTAVYPKRIFSRFVMAFSTIGISIPVFLTAILLIYVFSIELGWLPSYGRGELRSFFGLWDSGFLSVDGFLHLILPSIALSSIMLPMFIRLTRSEMLEVLESDYVRFAEAKGLSDYLIRYKHALKNTLLPLITIGGVQIGSLIAYTILTETIFQWPGTGSLFIEAVHRADTPLITTYIIFVGFIFVFVNTIVDLLYVLINPTIKLS